MSNPTEYLNAIEFEHAQKVEALEDKLTAMQDERDEWRQKANEESNRYHPLTCEIKAVTEAAMVIELDNHKLRERIESLKAERDQGSRVIPALYRERDDAIADRDKIQGLFDLANDQAVRLAQKLTAIREILDK